MAPYSYFHKNVNTCIKKDKVKCSKRISDINAGGRIYQLVLLFCTFLLSPIFFFVIKVFTLASAYKSIFKQFTKIVVKILMKRKLQL